MLLNGCMSNKLDKVVKELAKDNATVNIRVTTVYGTLFFTRTNPNTNSAPHTVAPDGSVTIK